MSRKRFGIQPEPQAPERRYVQQRIAIYDGQSLGEIFRSLPEDIDLHQVTFLIVSEYDESEDHYLVYQELESEATWERRQKEYRRDLEKYRAWKTKNAKQIVAELELRRLEQEADLRYQRERESQSLQDEERQLRKRLAQLEKLKANK